MAKRAKKRKPGASRWTELTVAQILAWADAFHARQGAWPTTKSGIIAGSLGEKWLNVDMALRRGSRGLMPGSSLARLFAERRAHRNRKALPRLTIKNILRWADSHRRRTGAWPIRRSGRVREAPGETWDAVGSALVTGIRGLKGGSSLAQLLAKYREVPNCANRPALTKKDILTWVDAYQRRHGNWPRAESGVIAEAPTQTWLAVDMALRNGLRGLPGRSSLAQFLNQFRGVRNEKRLPPLSVAKIWTWARAHRRRTGQWPRRDSGPIQDAPGETWCGVATALDRGRRGLPGSEPFTRLLARLKNRA